MFFTWLYSSQFLTSPKHLQLYPFTVYWEQSVCTYSFTSSFVVLGDESRTSSVLTWELMLSYIPDLLLFLFFFPKIMYLTRQNSDQCLLCWSSLPLWYERDVKIWTHHPILSSIWRSQSTKWTVKSYEKNSEFINKHIYCTCSDCQFQKLPLSCPFQYLKKSTSVCLMGKPSSKSY